jgi:hypothetical protein
LTVAVGPAGDLALSGELDMASAHVLEAAVAAHMPADRPVELDLEGLTFIDSSGIRPSRCDGSWRSPFPNAQPSACGRSPTATQPMTR